ncbi:MAG: PT domain-containing protein [Treponema sp.]|jgi:hypothetical protein|nr:PT domain-containing protein [Treponema sp.]
MADKANLEVLSTRAGFNSAVRHIKKTLAIVDELGDKANLGDTLHDLADGELTGSRIALLLRMLLVDRLGYKTLSVNLASVPEDLSRVSLEFAGWNGVDLVVSYCHPDLGLLVANPKSVEELANFGALRKRELLVIYAGKGSAPAGDDCQKALELAAILFQGGTVKVPQTLLKGNFTVKKAAAPTRKPAEPALSPPALPTAEPAAETTAEPTAKPKGRRTKKEPAAAAAAAAAAVAAAESPRAPVLSSASPAVSTGSLRMTPMYSVAVTNELFHNGNVEAWKRIISSYNAKYPDLKVYMYYEGERILDINSLFKWGKVKHGSAIQFAVSGLEIKDVAKLQRYLVQGASNQFEAFLRGPVSSVMKLFG